VCLFCDQTLTCSINNWHKTSWDPIVGDSDIYLCACGQSLPVLYVNYVLLCDGLVSDICLCVANLVK
jgi:hypothetical protein